MKQVLEVTWRAVPLLSGLDTKMAVKDPDTCRSCIMTVGRWGSENTPVVVVGDLPLTLALHLVSLHNSTFAAKAA